MLLLSLKTKKKLYAGFPNPAQKLQFFREGQYLTLQQTQTLPMVSFPFEDDHYYSLVMIDPDAPSPLCPHNADMLHWMVVNIQIKNEIISKTVMPYKGPGPKKGSGPHRYMFFLFSHPAPIHVGRPRKHRARFNLTAWVQRHSMILRGYTYFVTERY